MQPQRNLISDKRTKQWTIQRKRTKQSQHIQHKINRGKPGIGSDKRRSFRKYAHRTGLNLQYVRPRCVV